jgi:TonB family protein
MPGLRKLAPMLLLVFAPVWGQSASATQQSEATPAQKDAASSTSQDHAGPLPDSTHLIAIKTEKAKYPFEARKEKLQGQVLVQIHVSETGDVDQTEVVSGDATLAKAAVEAARKWKFKPYIKDGKPVQVSTKLPFNFAFSETTHDEDAPPQETKSNSAAGGAVASGASAAPQRVHIAQGVSAGLLLHKVQPLYPPDARRLRIQGTVVLHAVIGKDGRIKDLRLVSGSKELAPAAIGAVQQWIYQPYLLLGNPVEVDTIVQVNFQLNY